MSHTPIPIFFDYIPTTTISTSTTIQSTKAFMDSILTPRTVVIAAAICIVILVLVIICLIWTYITMNSSSKSPITDKKKQIEIVVQSNKDRKRKNKTKKFHQVQSTSVLSNHDQIAKIMNNLDKYEVSSPTVNIVVTPPNKCNEIQLAMDNDENFALIAANVHEQQVTAINEHTNGTIDPNEITVDELKEPIIESRRESDKTNVLSEGRSSLQTNASEGKNEMRLQPLPDKGTIVMDNDSIYNVGDGILHENDEAHSFTSNTVDSNTSGSTVRFRLPKNVTKAHWM